MNTNSYQIKTTPVVDYIIDALGAAGIQSAPTTTGGGCTAIEVNAYRGDPTSDFQILITNGDASFPTEGDALVTRHGQGEDDNDRLFESTPAGYRMVDLVASIVAALQPGLSGELLNELRAVGLDARVDHDMACVLITGRGFEVAIDDGDGYLPEAGRPVDVTLIPADADSEGVLHWQATAVPSPEAIVAQILDVIAERSPRRVAYIYMMEVAPGVTEDQVAYAAYAAYVQFAEPVLSDADDGEPTHGALRRVAMLPFDPALMDRLTIQSAAREMTIPEYVAAVAEIDGM